MRSSHIRPVLKTAILLMMTLLLTAGVSFAQSTVSLTAARQTATLPDGNSVPMWGWVCGTGTPVTAGGTGTPAAAGGATCTAMNRLPQVPGAPGSISATWQPPLIVVPTGNTLTITLTNALPVETSLWIVGQPAQLGGGLGTPVREATPRNHPSQQETTWTANFPATFTPPAQGLRARSFVAEAAAGSSQTYTWTSALKPGTYLIETGTYPSIQGPMGLYGILVVTSAPAAPPAAFAPGTAYPNIKYDADVPLLLSEIDPVQNASVAAIFPNGVANAGFDETTKWNPGCGQTHTCYPPAVDYTPLYYLVNGLSFDLTAATSSAAAIPAAYSTGNVLLRLVNAGSRMHMPSVAGLNMSLIAEDGNVLPDVALAAGSIPPKPLTVRVQSDVFLSAGKVYDVMVSPANNGTGYNSGTYQVFDRELSLSANASRHDSGMQTTLLVGGAAITPEANAKANNDKYIVPVAASTFSANVLDNDIGIHNASATATFGACVVSPAPQNLTTTSGNKVVLNPNGSFTLTVTVALPVAGDTFQYCGNGNPAFAALVTLVPAGVGGAPVANNDSYATSNTTHASSLLKIAAPGVLGNDVDPTGYPLSAILVGNTVSTGLTVKLNSDGSFLATLTTPPAALATTTATFQYYAVNSQGTRSLSPATVTLTFQGGSGLKVRVQDAKSKVEVTDYKWIIEQDLTFKVNPTTQVNTGGTVPPTVGTNFHTSSMPVIAVGCTGPQSCERDQTVYDNDPSSPTFGQHVPAVCDGGLCTPVAPGANNYLPIVTPDQVSLAATNPDGTPASYYISVLPGDSSNPFNSGNVGDPAAGCDTTGTASTPTGQTLASNCGHTMGGSPVAAPVNGVFAPVTVNVEPNPLPTATVTVFVFEDDWPLNGEHDSGGGIDVLATQERGLEDFQVILWDAAGSTGDLTGQMTYDIFNEPLNNSLNGILDPLTGQDACPISNAQTLPQGSNAIVGVIIVCPKFESDGKTLSPLAGQAVIKNLMPGRFSVLVHPGAAREARGEEWLQTNTLDGGHGQDTFVRTGEPSYFQEFGPGGYHVFFGMANPKIINNRLASICNGTAGSPNGISPAPPAPACNNTVKGQVTNLHMSRPPDERLFDSAVFPLGDARNYAALAHTQCYVSLGDTDGATIALTKCDANGNYTFTGIPDGDYGIVVFDQWLDIIVDGSSKPVHVVGGTTATMDYMAFTWQTHIWTNTYLDVNGNGIQDPGEPGIGQVPSRIRFRNGKFSNTMFGDLNGHAYFNEIFPLFSWFVTESDTTRFRGTGVHVVYDVGGQPDAANTSPYAGILNSTESNSLPTNLRVPGAVYCHNADCSDVNFGTTPTGGGPGGSTGRIDPGTVTTEGVQGFIGQTEVLDWGKQPYAVGETGGIRGHVVYSSTRPFDDPQMLFQNLWEPLVPGVTMNLYKEGVGPDGTQILTLIDTTTTSSWDAWAQGFRADGVTPNMSCPGQDPLDPYFNYTLRNTRHYLKPNSGLPNNSQFKCYDGMHVFNQVQPAPYDGLYQFPSPTCTATPGARFTSPSGQSITCATVHNTALDSLVPGNRTGAVPAVLPAGKYVVEVVPPPGYEITKEEDKNILMGDNFIAPVTQQFGAIGNIFIVPDQATINNANPSYTGPVTCVPTPGITAGCAVGSITVALGGTGYSTAVPPAVTITGGGGSGATATAVVDNTGAVIVINVVTGGNGYTAAPTVIIAPPSAGTTATATAAIGFNPLLQNPGNPTVDMGRNGNTGFGPGGLLVQNAPCVGALRVVPDFMSISPESGEVAPFAGVSRNLCDRKEVILEDQMQVSADFFVWTKTPAATHFTGFILDDFSSEFDPAAPAFGEKFAIPNVPVSIKDPFGLEVSRVYSDQWGIYNGLVYSTFDVNPPNPTGYSPNMMVTCMNDKGPIPGPNGTMIPDPSYNPAYSNFCYENPFMPGDTTYLDTPVVPVSAFAEAYNQPDCAYPDTTPAIKQVDATDGVGPWVASPDGGQQVASVAVTNGGTGYTSAPTVSFSGGGGGAGATATATIGVASVVVSNGGSGYNAPATVTFSAPPSGVTATGTANMRVGSGSIMLTSPGSGYTTRPSVTFTGGGGTGATASVTDLQVVSVHINNGGSGYTSTPTVFFDTDFPPTGVSVTLSGGHITSITVTTGGSGMTAPPPIEISGGGGSGATAVAVMGVRTIALGAGGSGFTSLPGLTIGAPTGAGGTTATASVMSLSVSVGVSGVTITNGGSGYTSAPTVAFSAPASGVTAVGSARMGVTAVTVTVGGFQYLTAPTVVFNNAGTGGSGAIATATLGPSPQTHHLIITALGDQVVPNHAYSGPAATTAPFNQKFVTRHYGFGAAQGTGSVRIAGVNAPVVSWSDSQIEVRVPIIPAAQSSCPIAQPGVTGQDLANFRCGELVITTSNGKQSIDTVTVTVGGKAPTRVLGENATNNAIQAAIDGAAPGDLIIVGPGTYFEMLLMWKPLMLQGVGAASSTVDANAHPAGKLDPWRRQVVCLFGLALNGAPVTATNPYDPNPDPTTQFVCPADQQLAVDRVEKEGIVGWDTSVNGNLAELLAEPTIMGAYEGAGITVLSKGVRYPAGSDPFIRFRPGDPEPREQAYPDGTVLLTNSAADCAYMGNFLCAPSRIDGLSVTDSSQGGGGIFVHGWAHNLEISNNRVFSNAGTLTGGIIIGQGEFSDPIVVGGDAFNVAAAAANQQNPGYLDATSAVPPRPFSPDTPNGTQLGYGYNTHVNVHHNSVTLNAAFGDELFSATPAGAGGVAFCTGADYYKFNYNWVCGNLSTGDGGGVAHLGFSYNGDISHNTIIFNQSYNPTITTYGGGLVVMSTAPDAPAVRNGVLVENECGSKTDVDCGPGPSDGTGPGLVIDANLIMGNTAESGSGGGLRLQKVNGKEVSRFPNSPSGWYAVSVTNNIIVNNVAGWAGGGISVEDTVLANIINNTIISNDTTASAGVLFGTNGAPQASVAPPPCPPPALPGCNPITTSTNQPAGLETSVHSAVLHAQFATGVSCPAGHPNCTSFSSPRLANNIITGNRAFHITTGANPIPGLQNVVTLAPQLSQTATGACPTTGFGGGAGPSIWDFGVLGDTGPGNHASGFTLSLQSSITGGTNPGVVRRYCNGSRIPPEIASLVCTNGANAPGCQGGGQHGSATVPPGVPDVNPFYPLFTLNPAATVDEGNNFINMFYGPLSVSNAALPSGAAGHGVALGNYDIVAGSPARGAANASLAPNHDFYGRARPVGGGGVDVGAVQFAAAPAFLANPTSLVFNARAIGSTSPAQTVTLSNTGNADVTGITVTFAGANANNFARSGGTCGGTLAVNANCTITVTFTPSAIGIRTATMSISTTNAGMIAVALTGGGPFVTATPASLTFASQAVGTSSVAQTVTVTNSGNAPLTAISVTFGGTNPGSFTQTNTCVTSLAPNATCTISVSFAPVAPLAQSATMSITGAAANTATVTLSGTGVGPLVGAAPASLTFALQAVGTPSAAQTVTVSNTGNATLNTISFAFGGTNPTEFARAGGTCGTTLAAGANCTMTVTFNPSAPGARSATMSISGAIPANTATVTLNGTGLGPILAASPTSVTFTSQLQGTTSPAETVTISNTGTGPLSAMTVTFGGTNSTDFARAGGTCGATLAVNASCTITVNFRPTAMGARSATLSISGAAPANTATVALSGTGTAPVVGAAPPSVAFGDHLIHDTSAAQTVTVSNTGTAPLNTISVTFGGTNPTSFARSGGTCTTTLAAGASCTINVTFTPQALGALSATVTVSGAAPANSVTVTLSGTGTPPPANPSPNPVAFGTVVAHTVTSTTVVVTNVGSASITFTPSTVSGTNYSKTGDTCAGVTLAVSATCTITVTLNPTSLDDSALTTTRNGTLTVNNSGGNVVVPLSATVTQAVIEMNGPGGLNTGGTNLKSGTVSVLNVGSAPFVISSAAVTGTGFTKGADSCTGTALQPSQTCTVVVNYNPGGSTTTRTGTLTLTGSGAFATTQTTTFSGN